MLGLYSLRPAWITLTGYRGLIRLHQYWKQRQVHFRWILIVTLLLIALGLLGTFPPFAQVFGGG